MRLVNLIPTNPPTFRPAACVISGPSATTRPMPSWPPTCGSLIFVIGLPSGPAAVPDLVCRSVGVLDWVFERDGIMVRVLVDYVEV